LLSYLVRFTLLEMSWLSYFRGLLKIKQCIFNHYRFSTKEKEQNEVFMFLVYILSYFLSCWIKFRKQNHMTVLTFMIYGMTSILRSYIFQICATIYQLLLHMVFTSRSWFVMQGPDGSIVAGSTLEISSLTKSDHWTCACHAGNGYGNNATKNIFITVNCKH
jgi:hypothetical protein